MYRAFLTILILVVPTVSQAATGSIFANDGRTIATLSADHSVTIWASESRADQIRIDGHNDDIHLIRFSPDSRQLVTASEDGTAKIWSAGEGLLLATLPMASPVVDARYSANGQKILTRSANGKLALWFASDGSLLPALADFDDVIQADIAPDGSRVVATLDDGLVQIWDKYDADSIVTAEGYAVTPSAKHAVEAVTGDNPAHTQVKELLQAWSNAWSRQDTASYLGFYSDAFEPADKTPREAWRKQRIERVSAPAKIKVALDGVDVAAVNDSALVAMFTQRYQSDRFADVCQKEIRLVKEGAEYRILTERSIACH